MAAQRVGTSSLRRGQKNDLQLSPVAVQVIYLILPLMMAACNDLGERLARRLGRIPTCVSCKLLGLCCLVTMALIKDWVAPAVSIGSNTTVA